MWHNQCPHCHATQSEHLPLYLTPKSLGCSNATPFIISPMCQARWSISSHPSGSRSTIASTMASQSLRGWGWGGVIPLGFLTQLWVYTIGINFPESPHLPVTLQDTRVRARPRCSRSPTLRLHHDPKWIWGPSPGQ
jgi:hypothetical protein